MIKFLDEKNVDLLSDWNTQIKNSHFSAAVGVFDEDCFFLFVVDYQPIVNNAIVSEFQL